MKFVVFETEVMETLRVAYQMELIGWHVFHKRENPLVNELNLMRILLRRDKGEYG